MDRIVRRRRIYHGTKPIWRPTFETDRCFSPRIGSLYWVVNRRSSDATFWAESEFLVSLFWVGIQNGCCDATVSRTKVDDAPGCLAGHSGPVSTRGGTRPRQPRQPKRGNQRTDATLDRPKGRRHLLARPSKDPQPGPHWGWAGRPILGRSGPVWPVAGLAMCPGWRRQGGGLTGLCGGR